MPVESPVMNPTIQIYTAVMMEAGAVSRRLRLAPTGPRSWAITDIALANVGIRAGRLGELAERFDKEKPRVLIMAGVAGGLDPALVVGDVVVQTSADFGTLAGKNWRVGARMIATADAIVSSAQAKRVLRERTGCIAVDMETERAENFAREHGMHFMAIRAISDTAGEVLDARVADLVDEDGRPKAGKLAATLLRHPSLVRDLSRLKKATDIACRNLAEAVELAVEGWRKILIAEDRRG